MRKRVFSSIFLTSFVTLLLTASLLLAAVYAGLSRDVQARLADECGDLAASIAQATDGDSLTAIGQSYADRVTHLAADGTVRYDNRMDAADMENHAARPEVAQALQTGVGRSERLSDTLQEKTYYYAVRLPDGTVLRLGKTAASAFGALDAASPWIVLVVLLALLVAAVLAGWLTRAFLGPILALDLRAPLQNKTYDELAPLLLRMDKQNRKIDAQLDELRRRQTEFDEITARMDEGLVLLAASGEILSANRTVRTLFPAASASGGYLNLCRDADYIRVVESALNGQAARGYLEKNGRVYALSASPVARAGAGHAAVLFLVDVTERERAEQQRQEFSANVSHELKTPLTSIMGYAEIMENGVAQPQDIGRFAGKIRVEAARLTHLIEDILRLSSLDEGGLQAQFEPVELLALCEGVRARLAEKAARSRVTVEAAGAETTVAGERRTLEQMLFNLADNAIAYNKPGGSVTLWAGLLDGAPALRVSDTGIGIAPADQQRVFERFYRVDKSRSKLTGGTGLGLSIVKHGAKLHSASVALQSREGEGTEITIRFPQIE